MTEHDNTDLTFRTGELVGGEDRVDKTLFYECGDSLICNFGTTELEELDKNNVGPL